MTKEETYNRSITEAMLGESIAVDPREMKVLTYAKPHDVCDGIEIHLGNQAGGYPFELNGVHFDVEVPVKEDGRPMPFALQGQEWKSVEYLYLCGEWSWEGDDAVSIQTDVCTATSGYAAHRFKKSKHAKQVRQDYNDFRLDWMFWCVWQKCKGSKAYAEHLLSMPDDRVIIEVVKRDKVWAAWPDEEDGIYRGNNAMGKILTICRRCLIDGTEPKIDTDKLNKAGIWILGTKLHF